MRNNNKKTQARRIPYGVPEKHQLVKQIGSDMHKCVILPSAVICASRVGKDKANIISLLRSKNITTSIASTITPSVRETYHKNSLQLVTFMIYCI